SSRRSSRPLCRQTAEPRLRQESSHTRLRRNHWDLVAVLARSDTLPGQMAVVPPGPTLARWKWQEPAGPLPGRKLEFRLFAFFFFPFSLQTRLRAIAGRASYSGTNSAIYPCTGSDSRFKYSSPNISLVCHWLQVQFKCRTGAVTSNWRANRVNARPEWSRPLWIVRSG